MLMTALWESTTEAEKFSVVPRSNRDGRFTLNELLEFTDLVRLRSRCYQPYEFQAQMQGYCTLQLWKAICQEGGQQAFVDWCVSTKHTKIVTQDYSLHYN
jgi:hypothetical protein